MKSTGIVRKIDELGRIVLPMEIRTVLGIESRDPLEIYTEGELIVLKKYAPATACVFCGRETDDATTVNGKRVCRECLADLQKAK